jgi:hypothetical protein
MPQPKPVGLFDPMPDVTATFDDGTRKKLFSFYPDELRFDECEFIGKTEAEAHEQCGIPPFALSRMRERQRMLCWNDSSAFSDHAPSLKGLSLSSRWSCFKGVRVSKVVAAWCV